MIGRVWWTAAAMVLATMPTHGVLAKEDHSSALAKVAHIVVIYEENHSFDNLYGGWEGVNGLAAADVRHTRQVNQHGIAFGCLWQNDVNLASPPLAVTCSDTTTATALQSHFPNAPFVIDTYIPSTAKTCPPPFAAHGVLDPNGRPGGCTADSVHRFYQEQYQLDRGTQDRYVTGSDAAGLVMGVYDTRRLPIYRYLHAAGHPRYCIADAFFQAAFGGSFLNHHYLVAAQPPVYPKAPNDGAEHDLHSVVDENGMPVSYPPLYVSPAPDALRDDAVAASCNPPAGRGPTPVHVLCGDYVVNTLQPSFEPHDDTKPQLPPLSIRTIGDALDEKRVKWVWYAGGWSNANGDVSAPGWTNGAAAPCSDPKVRVPSTWPHCPDRLFQFHHQPFNYYRAFDPGTREGIANRAAHLRDEAEFLRLASSRDTCGLKPVSFVKPLGEENEHPGYASESTGSDHLVTLLRAIQGGACAADTLVIVTYDEFGGEWDHVSPPGQGDAPGPHDAFGPGTRVPALVLSPLLRAPFVVDHSPHDTTSILATIEHRFGLAPLATRDAQVTDLASVFEAAAPDERGRGKKP